MVSEVPPDPSVVPTPVSPENGPQEFIDSVMLSLISIFDSNPAAARYFCALFDPDSGYEPTLANFEAL